MYDQTDESLYREQSTHRFLKMYKHWNFGREEENTDTTGSPSLKYEHRRTSALLRNIQNIRICVGKKPIVSVTYENERISIKNSLPYLKCVLRLSCVVHGPIYGRFMGFYVNGFLSL